MRNFRALGNFIFLLVTAGLGVFMIIVGVGGGVFPDLASLVGTAAGMAITILIGVLLTLAGVHFLIAIADERLDASLFVREGERGRIGVSPHAIREFISGILRDEIGIERFRVRLDHHRDGVGITVRMTLSPDQRVTEVGESIQRELMQHVAERTGVEVREVSVLVKSIRSRGRGRETADDAAGGS